MDLRIEKTERGIKNAFIELRSRKPLEKITVKELCESARINKSTFYAHYKDIYDLSDAMEEDTAMNVMLSFCIQGSYHAYQKNRSGDIMTVIDVIAGMTGAVRPMYEERLGESRS